jgi:hypothetical protein
MDALLLQYTTAYFLSTCRRRFLFFSNYPSQNDCRNLPLCTDPLHCFWSTFYQKGVCALLVAAFFASAASDPRAHMAAGRRRRRAITLPLPLTFLTLDALSALSLVCVNVRCAHQSFEASQGVAAPPPPSGRPAGGAWRVLKDRWIKEFFLSDCTDGTPSYRPTSARPAGDLEPSLPAPPQARSSVRGSCA